MMKHPDFCPHALVLLILHSLIMICVFFFLSTAGNETSAAAAAANAAGIPSLDQTATKTNQEEHGNYEEALQIHDEFAKVVVLTHSSGGALDKNIEDHVIMGSLEVQCDGAADEEECMKRRLMSEAHLDYIYTQHHKP